MSSPDCRIFHHSRAWILCPASVLVGSGRTALGRTQPHCLPQSHLLRRKTACGQQLFSPISRLHIDTTTFIGGTPNLDAATAGGGHRQSAHPSETTFTFDLRLTLDSSFTGKDLLRTRLRAGNTPALPALRQQRPDLPARETQRYEWGDER